MKTFKSKSNSLVWVGVASSGEYVALNSRGEARDMYQPETVGGQPYVTNVGCWDPKPLKKLSKKDREFLEAAHEGQVDHCVECYDACFATECPEAGVEEYKWTEDGLVCLECFEEYAAEHLEDYVNKSKQCIPLATAETLAKDGRIEFIERFIGGMVDGRGGSFGGESVREGQPTAVLADLLSKHPKGEFVFSHDESGQFQTYFSVWRVKPVRKTKRGAK